MAYDMLPQERLIERLRALCREDERLEGAMLYGSFARQEADQFSDIDAMLYFEEGALEEIDQRAWLEGVAPVELFYVNEFGVSVAIFDGLIRGEFHFDPAGAMEQLAGYRGRISFPSLEAALLVDKTGRLSQALRPLIGPPPSHESADEIRALFDSFHNWFLFGGNLFRRGEYARSLEVMGLVQDNLLRMARLQEGRGERWITPTKNLEGELSPAAYRRFQACTAPLEPEAMEKAYRAAWDWGNELMADLARRYRLARPPGSLSGHIWFEKRD
jgi:lincosamide nucleotidyltransferase